MNFKNKLLLKATIAGVLDLFALGFIGYFAVKTLSMLLFVLLLCAGLVFIYDLKHAIQFITRLIKNN